MDLLEFAKGPALQVAAYILVAGSIWRIVGIVRKGIGAIPQIVDFYKQRNYSLLNTDFGMQYTHRRLHRSVTDTRRYSMVRWKGSCIVFSQSLCSVTGGVGGSPSLNLSLSESTHYV